jgi:hypothetical protein
MMDLPSIPSIVAHFSFEFLFKSFSFRTFGAHQLPRKSLKFKSKNLVSDGSTMARRKTRCRHAEEQPTVCIVSSVAPVLQQQQQQQDDHYIHQHVEIENTKCCLCFHASVIAGNIIDQLLLGGVCSTINCSTTSTASNNNNNKNE